jgi:hypothetical protein
MEKAYKKIFKTERYAKIGSSSIIYDFSRR